VHNVSIWYVVAFAFHGHITKTDHETVLRPVFEDRLKRHKRVRIYIEFAPDFARVDPGAVWEDTKLDFMLFFHWERCRAFSIAQAGEARDWIIEGQQ
jgi:SpoIIAA-like